MLLTNVCSIHYASKIRQYFFEKTDFEGLAMRLTIAGMRSPRQSATVVWTFLPASLRVTTEGSKQGVIRGGSEREY